MKRRHFTIKEERLKGNSCNQILTLLNTAEIVKNYGWGKNTPLLWSRFEQWFSFMTNLNRSYKALISSTLIWILICGSIVEWYAVNYSENHQSGWQFTGMIMMAIIVIPLSLLLSQISEYFKKDIGKRVYLLLTLILVPGIYLLLWSGALANWKMLNQITVQI